jgi:hypothetical protein
MVTGAIYEQDIMQMRRLYHRDGTACLDPWSCGDEDHTCVPPHCAAVMRADTGMSLVACDLPSGHPGPHLHLASEREF